MTKKKITGLIGKRYPKVGIASVNPAKKRRGPGVPFLPGPDARRWTGRRIDAERREAEKDFRLQLIDISRERCSGTDEHGKAIKASKLEMLARVYWGKALAGHIDFGNAILDRMFGKPVQPVTGDLNVNAKLSLSDFKKSMKGLGNEE